MTSEDALPLTYEGAINKILELEDRIKNLQDEITRLRITWTPPEDLPTMDEWDAVQGR